jgi:hypothetical protein
MNKNMLMLIARQAAQLVPEVRALLSNKTRYILHSKQDYKTAEYMQSAIEGLVNSLYSGFIGGEFIDTLANIISGQLTQAFQQAYNDEGYEGELPDYLASALESMILNQYDFVDQFFRDIVDARIDGTPLAPLMQRAGMWASQWGAAYREAVRLIQFEAGGNFKWVKGATEHGCETCSNLNGIVMSAKEWEQLDVHPRGYPNSKLQCGGGGPANNCDCDLVPTKQRRSPDAYGRVEEIIL